MKPGDLGITSRHVTGFADVRETSLDGATHVLPPGTPVVLVDSRQKNVPKLIMEVLEQTRSGRFIRLLSPKGPLWFREDYVAPGIILGESE